MQISQAAFDAAVSTVPLPRPSRAQRRLSPVRRDTAIMLASGVVVRICGLVFMMVLSRHLSRQDIGVFSFYEAIADTLTLIAGFSLEMVILRRIAAGTREDAMMNVAPLLAFRIMSAPVYLLSITIVAQFVSGPRWLLPCVGFYTLMESAFFSFGSFFIGVKRIGLKAAIEAGAEVVFTSLFLVAIYRYPSIKTLIVLSTAHSALLLGTGIYLAHRFHGPLHLRFAPVEMLRAGAPFVFMSLLGLLQGRMETMLLGFLASLSATGAYELSLKLVVAASFIPQSINLAVYPYIAADGLTALNRSRLLRGLLLLAALGVGSAGVLFFFSNPVARVLFGPMAGEVAPVLRAIAPALLMRFLASGIASGVIAMEGEKSVFRSLVAGTIVGLAADCLLIPHYKASGAAIGMMISAACQCVVTGAALLSLVAKARDTEGDREARIA